METPGPDDWDEIASHKSEELQEKLHGTAVHVPEENRHEDLQKALQPHVTEEDDRQEVRRHPQGAQPSLTPRRQKMAQEEDRDEETQEDFFTVEQRSDTSPRQDYPLSQGALPNRPQRKKNPLNKF